MEICQGLKEVVVVKGSGSDETWQYLSMENTNLQVKTTCHNFYSVSYGHKQISSVLNSKCDREHESECLCTIFFCDKCQASTLNPLTSMTDQDRNSPYRIRERSAYWITERISYISLNVCNFFFKIASSGKLIMKSGFYFPFGYFLCILAYN